MYNVICLKHGDKFDAGYVNKLFHGVRRNTTVEFVFHCFTENPEGLEPDIEIHGLPYDNITGWWQKIYLLSDEIGIEGRVLYIDLDTLITGNIDHYICQNEGFVVLQDLWAKHDNVGSALMSYEVGKHKHVWETFINDPVGECAKIAPHGDQKIIQKYQTERKYWQFLFPNEVVSFKTSVAQPPGPNTKIICFHGIPSIQDSITNTTKVQQLTLNPAKWVTQYWREDDH